MHCATWLRLLQEDVRGSIALGSARCIEISYIPHPNRGVGMQTVDMALMDLVEEGLIAPEEAWLRAEKQETFEGLCSPAFLKDAQAFN